MIDEYIKSETKKELGEISNLPLNSNYKVLLWRGQANGINILPGFDINDIVGRIFILKSFKIFPYYNGAGIDITLFDGATTSNETVWNGSRIVRLFDDYSNGAYINFSINGSLVPFFTNPGSAGYPLDLNLDNIYYKHKSKIQTMDIQINSRVINDLTTGNLVVPLVKVVVECYLI